MIIWDGVEFRTVNSEEGEFLAKEDKAQIMDGTVDGLSLKYRRQFTGYSNKMKEGGKPNVELQELERKAEAPVKRNLNYRKLASEAFSIPYAKVTKEDIARYKEEIENGST